jgi:hypothetical protein
MQCSSEESALNIPSIKRYFTSVFSNTKRQTISYSDYLGNSIYFAIKVKLRYFINSPVINLYHGTPLAFTFLYIDWLTYCVQAWWCKVISQWSLLNTIDEPKSTWPVVVIVIDHLKLIHCRCQRTIEYNQMYILQRAGFEYNQMYILQRAGFEYLALALKTRKERRCRFRME